MNKSVKGVNWLDTLPNSLAIDADIKAFAAAFSNQLNKIADEMESIIIYPAISKQPEEMLDTLAKDFKVDWYDYHAPLEVKRQTVAQAIKIHRIKGTRGAVDMAINAIYQGSRVQEWHEMQPPGEPYTFILNVEVMQQGFNVEQYKRLLKAIDYYKNIRSHMAGAIGALVTAPAELKVAATTDIISIMETEVYTVRGQLIDELSQYLKDEYDRYLCYDEIYFIDENGDRLVDENIYLVDENGDQLMDENYRAIIDDWGGYLCQDPDNTDKDYPEYNE